MSDTGLLQLPDLGEGIGGVEEAPPGDTPVCGLRAPIDRQRVTQRLCWLIRSEVVWKYPVGERRSQINIQGKGL